MLAQRCENCRWWDNAVQHRDAQPDTTGLCRITSPRVNRHTGRAAWPFTEDSDWCGSFCARAAAVEEDEEERVTCESCRKRVLLDDAHSQEEGGWLCRSCIDQMNAEVAACTHEWVPYLAGDGRRCRRCGADEERLRELGRPREVVDQQEGDG